MAVKLRAHQKKAVDELSSGKILWAPVGVGKSLTAIAYYAEKDQYGDLYVITTAKKRDSLEWEHEAAKYGIGKTEDTTNYGKLVVDSWNNIGKYVSCRECTFILDEQRLVGSGKWVKSFYKIAKNNSWLVLTATPGDTWLDYAPVFIANGYYKNITAFKREHVVYAPFSRYPKIERFIGEKKLKRLKEEVLVEMPYLKHTEREMTYVEVDYDEDLMRLATVKRWNPYTDEPIVDAAELFSVMRRITNEDPSRLKAIKKLLKDHPRLIIFYNFNYELQMLRQLNKHYRVAEWNGHKKEEIPDTEHWVYLVQYTAGAEGWNCTSTDAMAFYSLNYSYKRFEQAQGRIDRMNTLYKYLSYFALISTSTTDRAVLAALKEKKTFNERAYLRDKKLAEFGEIEEFVDTCQI